MSTPHSVFVTEGNVGIYLSRLQVTWNAEECDHLLSLVAEEESRRGLSRENLENGERRVVEGRARIESQIRLVAQVPIEKRADSVEARLLETFEKTQAILEDHVRVSEVLCDRGVRGELTIGEGPRPWQSSRK
jgi:hypothetical protein